MQAIKSRVGKPIPFGTYLTCCDNSGAKIIRVHTVVGRKTVYGRIPNAGIGDLIQGSVKSGKPEMRKTVVYAVIVRQKKEFKRPNGTRVKFEDNAAVVVKDLKGNPKGTTIKGPIAKEVGERWSVISKIASMIV